MNIDIKQFKEFCDQMEWEGGLEGIVRHGHDSTGDVELDSMLENLEMWLSKADGRIRHILETHRVDLEASEEDEDDDSGV